MRKKIAWFSAGITSAVACRLALQKYDNVEIYYIEVGLSHSDNARFIKDCEKWYGKKINIVKNSKGFENHVDVINKTRYVNGVGGARCTVELKKNVRFELEKELDIENQIFGFEFSKSEINRAVRFEEQYPDARPLFPLIENKLSKNECAGILQSAGIEIPEMYKLGYNNNNCIGCVKGGKWYWNKIKKDFPEIFNEVSQAEKEVGHSCIKNVYLDDLKEGEGRKSDEVQFECGVFCEVEFADIIHPKTLKIINS